MKICIVGGMIDAKLHSKIFPLQKSELITSIHLIRRQAYSGNKIICHSVPQWAQKLLPLAECWRLTQLFGVCLFHRPKVLIAFGTMPHGIYVWLISKLFRIKTIQHIMGKNDLRLTFSKQRGQKIAMRAVRSANLVAVRGQPMIQTLLVNGVNADNIFIPQNLHDFDFFSCTIPTIPEYELIYVGLLAAYKRIDLMLESFASSKPNNNKLLIIGDGPEKNNLERQAIELNIEHQVIFAGKISFQNLPKYYCKARSFIMTSQGEGLPMAMIEAMSCGLPVIISDDADITEIAKNEVNALITNSHHKDCFAQAIVRLRNDESLYQLLRHNALSLRDTKLVEYSVEFQSRLWTEKIESLYST
ncbi:hypothetical protein MNBD_GAMMA12-1708 [hydrothermal vent metagenome]|uniref:Glycosyl transferase family 1 domain-containing protein n=1 Tax=hydrothermal vent metagenome TaxID=652676 RepID=A0A3B0YV12_9ZZZZ